MWCRICPLTKKVVRNTKNESETKILHSAKSFNWPNNTWVLRFSFSLNSPLCSQFGQCCWRGLLPTEPPRAQAKDPYSFPRGPGARKTRTLGKSGASREPRNRVWRHRNGFYWISPFRGTQGLSQRAGAPDRSGQMLRDVLKKKTRSSKMNERPVFKHSA